MVRNAWGHAGFEHCQCRAMGAYGGPKPEGVREGFQRRQWLCGLICTRAPGLRWALNTLKHVKTFPSFQVLPGLTGRAPSNQAAADREECHHEEPTGGGALEA